MEEKTLDNKNKLNEIYINNEIRLDKYFTVFFTFDKYADYTMLAWRTYYHMQENMTFKEVMENKLEMYFRNIGNELCSNIKKILSEKNIPFSETSMELCNNFFYNTLDKLREISKYSLQASGSIENDLRTLEHLQKYSRPIESTFMIGNLPTIALYGITKGIKTINRNNNELSERTSFKNQKQQMFMKELNSVLKSLIDGLIDHEFRNIYNLIFGNILSKFNKDNGYDSLGEYQIIASKYNNLWDAKFKLYTNDSTYLSREELTEYLNIYPYSLEVWELYFLKLEISECEQIENDIKILNCPELSSKFQVIKRELIILKSETLQDILSNSSYFNFKVLLNLFNKRFFNKITEEVLQNFLYISKSLYNISLKNITSEYDILLLDILKASISDNMDKTFEKNKKCILKYEKDLLQMFKSDVLFKYFFKCSNIETKIKSFCDSYMFTVRDKSNLALEKIQNEINNEINYLKQLTLGERLDMGSLILSDCFHRVKRFKNKNQLKIDSSNIHLIWETNISSGAVSLTQIYSKQNKELLSIQLNEIEKVKILNENSIIGIQLELQDLSSYFIPILKQSSDDKNNNFVRGIALYIKYLSNLWKSETDLDDLYLRKNLEELTKKYSTPNYLLELKCGKYIEREIYYKLHLKNGFVYNNDINEYTEKIRNKINHLLKLKENSKNILFYDDISNNLKFKLIEQTEKILNIQIDDEILIAYKEPNEDASPLLITETSLIITTNKFGVIPLKDIIKIELKGFINHTLEIKTTNLNLKCLLQSNDLDNKRFIDILNQYIN